MKTQTWSVSRSLTRYVDNCKPLYRNKIRNWFWDKTFWLARFNNLESNLASQNVVSCNRFPALRLLQRLYFIWQLFSIKMWNSDLRSRSWLPITAIYVLTCKLSVHKCNKLFITVRCKCQFDDICGHSFPALHRSFRDSKRGLEIKVGSCINLLLSQFLLDVLFHSIFGIEGISGFSLVGNVLIRDG